MGNNVFCITTLPANEEEDDNNDNNNNKALEGNLRLNLAGCRLAESLDPSAEPKGYPPPTRSSGSSITSIVPAVKPGIRLQLQYSSVQ
jgi:hypothetical protein